ncbi:MAG: BamA/TamA family outer membrane protein [Salinibacter sp.]
MRRIVFMLLVVGLLGGAAQAQPADTTDRSAADTSATADEQTADWLLLPFASYAPATKIAGGLVVGYYRSAPPGRSPSSVELTLQGTQRRQFTAQIEPELYVSEGRWRVQGELLATTFPNVFYDIGGDTPRAAEESYTARYGRIDLAAQRRLGPNLRVGPRLFVRAGTITDPEEGGLIDQGLVPGANGGVNAGVGLSALWDARNNIYYPTTGAYAEAAATWHSAVWGSDYTFGRLTADLRGYRSAGGGVVAAQAYAEATLGQAPFQLLPLLGGADRMRGYREGRFRDDVYWTLQAEYRLPLFWRLKGTVFASVGEVGPRVGADLFDEVEAAVGAGGRFRLTEDGVHGRLDVAYSRTGVELYISLGEAF